ncbi:hypothetical protein G7046_g8121 [Stylonectria norvegica]|nr:hypothetical protein G7046_g8121 [Stylonectria norvegica]
MLARQAAVRRTTLSAVATNRLLGRQIRPLGRQLSFLPWRQSKVPSDVKVYFPKAPSSLSKLQFPPPSTGFLKRLRRGLFTAIILYSCWQIFVTVVFDPLLDWADTEWETLSDKEKEEAHALQDEDEPILFLPFPFTTKEVKQPPYKGSDPEWATFVKLNQDPKLQKSIKLGLAEEIKKGVEKNPAFVKLLGGGTISIRKLWLDIIFPAAPPPKHYVAGILIDEDGIFWGDRPMDSTAASHLDKVLYPKAVALTAYAFVTYLFAKTVQDISKALGFSGPSPPEATWQSVTLERIRENGGLAGPGKQAVKIAGQSEKPAISPSPAGDADINIFGSLFGSDTQLDPRVQAAVQAASLTFARNWKPTKSPPNRGCVRVDGVVELRGKTRCMAVYVLGWYDPKERKYMSIQTGLKHLVDLKQRPAPG